MIKINKTSPAPEYLIYRGTSRETNKCHSETQKALAYFESEDYDPDNECEYEFKHSVYSNKIWKEKLLDDQSNKCCFCESKVAHVGAADVEHFRPKGESKQSISASANKPGYYWLAYEWDNLLIACKRCNSREKKSLFPLLNPDERASPTNKNIDREIPIFINPSNEDPEDFITFKREYPKGIDDERRGEKTLTELNLVNDDDLNEVRRTHLGRVEGLIDSVKIILNLLDKIDDTYGFLETPFNSEKSMGEKLSDSFEILFAYLGDSSHYTGMIRSNFEEKILRLHDRYNQLVQ